MQVIYLLKLHIRGRSQELPCSQSFGPGYNESQTLYFKPPTTLVSWATRLANKGEVLII
jgi:hypothetical protein